MAWPEYNYGVTWADLMNHIGLYVGFGQEENPDQPGRWTEAETRLLKQLVVRGVRRVHVPPAIGRPPRQHAWRCLRPTADLQAWNTISGTVGGSAPTYEDAVKRSTLTVAAAVFYPSVVNHDLTFAATSNAYNVVEYVSATEVKLDGDASGEGAADTVSMTADGDYDLPADFGYIEGKLTFAMGQGYTELDVVSESEIRRRRQYSLAAGQPLVAAVAPKEVSTSAEQSWFVMLWPTPDSSYTLTYRYHVLMPQVISRVNNRLPGGDMMSEVYIASCLAVAELHKKGQQGPKYADFIQQLESAVRMDLKSAPESLGDGQLIDREALRKSASTPVTYVPLGG